MSIFVCGGVISESEHEKNIKEHGVWADTMSYVMPDKQLAEYLALEEAGKKKEATVLFKKYARSQI